MRILASVGALAILIAVCAAVFFFGGYFNIAANVRDPGWLARAIIKVRLASIDRHAGASSPPRLDDPQLIRAGARAFAQRGCWNCHGAPGVNWQKFAEGLNPEPPDLTDVIEQRQAVQLFWVIKNGIKMTAMPSFGAVGADDKELWAIVAFVRNLPNVSESDYKAWAAQP